MPQINMTCVRSEYQRQGIAQQLIDITNRESMKCGCQGVYTQVQNRMHFPRTVLGASGDFT